MRDRAAERERRRKLREIARRHHPDLGGDPEAFIRAVAALGESRGRRDVRGPLVEVRRSAWWRLLVRRWVRSVRRRRRERVERRRRAVDARRRV